MELAIALFVVSSVLLVSATETGEHEAQGLLAFTASSLITMLYENRVALLSTTAIAVVACIYSFSSSPRGLRCDMPQQHTVARQRPGVYKRFTLAEREAVEALAHVAARSHASAARSYGKAAEYHNVEAEELKSDSRFCDAAEQYMKAATMLAAAWEQEKSSQIAPEVHDGLEQTSSSRLTGKVNYGEKKCLMHRRAAECYHALASKVVVSRNCMRLRSIHQATAEQYEEGAMSAQACGDSDTAVQMYYLAAEKYDAAGDPSRAQIMRSAADKLRHADGETCPQDDAVGDESLATEEDSDE